MRADHWQQALHSVFAAAHGHRFRWGYHDCFQFAAKCVKAVSGVEYRRLFPKYKTRAEAEALLAAHGGARGLLIAALGEPVHVSRAGAGDVVLIDMGRGEQPAVCMGVECFAPGRSRLHPYPTKNATAAWII